MRNLRLVTRFPQQLPLQLDGETLLASAVDAERRRAFFASSANFIYTVQLPASSTQGQVSNSIPSHPVPFDCCSSRILFVSLHAHMI
jgi:hypothetical protein